MNYSFMSLVIMTEDIKDMAVKTKGILKNYAIPAAGAITGYFVLSTIIPAEQLIMSLVDKVIKNTGNIEKTEEMKEDLTLMFVGFVYVIAGIWLFSGGSIKKFLAYAAFGGAARELWKLVKNVSNASYFDISKDRKTVTETDFGE